MHNREEYASKLRKTKKEDTIRKKRTKALEERTDVEQKRLEEVLIRVEPKLLSVAFADVLCLCLL